MKASEQTKVGIVGAGLMGHAIAQLFAVKGYPVSLFDSKQQVLEEAPERIRANFSAFLDLGLATPDDVERCLSQVQLCRSMEEATSDADVVVEAVSENLVPETKAVRGSGELCETGDGPLFQHVRNQHQPHCRTAGKKRTTRRNTLLESPTYCPLCRSNQITLHIRSRVRVRVPVNETDR